MSAISVRPVDAAAFPEIHAALLRDFRGGRIPEERWRRLFEHRWAPAGTPRGHALFDGERVVGFMGTIFADRTIGVRTERICNSSTLVVAEPWRQHSLKFVVEALRMTDVTITDLTPTPTVAAILKRLGFRELERSVTVLLPVPGGGRGTGAVVAERAAIAAAAPDVARCLADHEPYGCDAVMLESGDGACPVVFGQHHAHGVRYATLYAIGRPDLFQRESARLRSAVLARTGGLFVVADTRLLAGAQPPFSFRWSLASPRMYRSATLTPEQIDNLYSEFVLLQLATLPRLRRAAGIAVTALMDAALALA